MTHQLIPPPERLAIEKEIDDLFQNGDKTSIARLLQQDMSAVSRAFNPYEDSRLNPVFQFLLYLWAFDAIRDGLGDDIMAIVQRERSKWQPTDPIIGSHAELAGRVGSEYAEAVKAEISNSPHDTRIKEWDDVARAATAKKMSVIADRNGTYAAGTPISYDTRTMVRRRMSR